MKDRLLGFIDALRATGVAPTVAETLDAMHAVTRLSIERAALREGLAATLIKDHADRPVFDAVFDEFFGVRGHKRGTKAKPQPPSGGGTGGAGAPTGEPRTAADRPRQQPQVPHLQVGHRRAEHLHAHRDADHNVGHRLARQRALRHVPFEEMAPNDVEACEALVEFLARRFKAHLSRRQRSAARGRLDIRRTLRRAVSKGGVLINPAFRHRRPGSPDLVVLCDQSHSVSIASRFLLSLVLSARPFFRRVRLFAYVDQPVEVSIEHGHLVPYGPLDLYARSDFGRVLQLLWERNETMIGRNTIVLILGDARNNRRPARADVLARIHAVARFVVWLNPEPRQRWNTGDSVVSVYARHCGALLAAANLNELVSALKMAFRTI